MTFLEAAQLVVAGIVVLALGAVALLGLLTMIVGTLAKGPDPWWQRILAAATGFTAATAAVWGLSHTGGLLP